MAKDKHKGLRWLIHGTSGTQKYLQTAFTYRGDRQKHRVLSVYSTRKKARDTLRFLRAEFRLQGFQVEEVDEAQFVEILKKGIGFNVHHYCYDNERVFCLFSSQDFLKTITP